MNDSVDREEEQGPFGSIIDLINSIVSQSLPRAEVPALEELADSLRSGDISEDNRVLLGKVEANINALNRYQEMYDAFLRDALQARGQVANFDAVFAELKETKEYLKLLREQGVPAAQSPAPVPPQPATQPQSTPQPIPRQPEPASDKIYSEIELQQRISASLAQYEVDRNERERREINRIIDNPGIEFQEQKEDYESQLRDRDDIIDGLYGKIKEMEEQQEEPTPDSEPAEPEPTPEPALEPEPASEPGEDDVIDADFTVVEDDPEPSEPTPEPAMDDAYFSHLKDLFAAKPPEEKERDGLDYLRLAQKARTEKQYAIALMYAETAKLHIPDNMRVHAELSLLYLTTGKEEDLETAAQHADKVIATIPTGTSDSDPLEIKILAIARKNLVASHKKRGTFDSMSEDFKRCAEVGVPEGVDIYNLTNV